MVWSGGCDSVIIPHATIFARNGKTGPAAKSRLTMGTAMSAVLLPEDIGRPAMVEKVAAAVKDAMRDAGIDDPKDCSIRIPAAFCGIIGIRPTPGLTPNYRCRLDGIPARCTDPSPVPSRMPR